MDELIEMERQKWEAFRERDADRLSRMYNPGAVSIGYAGDGSVGARHTQALLEGLDDLDLDDLALDGFEVIPLGADSGIVTYRATYRTGRGVQTTVMASSVWHREGGEWKTMFFQATAVPVGGPQL